MSGLDALFNRPRPSPWQQFVERPCIYLARKLYSWSAPQFLCANAAIDGVSIICISDTHNSHPAIPDGDVLIHAGDLTQSGSFKELQAALKWLSAQSHPVKIVVAGNHDLLLDSSQDGYSSGNAAAERKMLDWGDIIYLENAASTVTCPNGRRLKIYGSPWSARHGDWAFQYERSRDVWAGTVPDGTDVLVTHGPPRGHLDLLKLGCPFLLGELWRVRPRLHVFGHVHEGAGTEVLGFDNLQAAYERTVVAGGGLWNLCRTSMAFCAGLSRRRLNADCILVNPSIVGGMRDDERRRAIQVTI